MAKIKYHVSHSYEDLKGNVTSFLTQLYSIGIYGIVNNDPQMQGSYTPQAIKKIEKNLKKAEEKKEIKKLTFGREITVTNESGFWEEVKL
jgi:hypothetical protein